MKIKLIILLLAITIQVNTQCTCKDNEYFDGNSWECKKIPSKKPDGYDENCLNYQMNGNKLECRQCQTQYFLQNIQNEIKCIKTNLEGCNDIKLKSQNRLQEAQINQRFLSDDNYECENCEDNYYLKDEKCQPYPTSGSDFVKYCDRYQYLQKLDCTGCQVGYYLQADRKKCIENPDTVKHCVGYTQDNVGEDPYCFACEGEYFTINGGQQCELSSKKVPFCLKAVYISNNKFTCLRCQDGYFPSADYQQCLENPKKGKDNYIKDCQIYIFKNQNDQKPLCKQCNDDFSLLTDQKSCQAVQKDKLVENCKMYQNLGQDFQGCKECKNEYLPTPSSVWPYKACRKCPYSKGDGQILKLTLFVSMILLAITLL